MLIIFTVKTIQSIQSYSCAVAVTVVVAAVVVTCCMMVFSLMAMVIMQLMKSFGSS